jgi:hypothetical protein
MKEKPDLLAGIALLVRWRGVAEYRCSFAHVDFGGRSFGTGDAIVCEGWPQDARLSMWVSTVASVRRPSTGETHQ